MDAVPEAFAQLVLDEMPSSIALSGGDTARRSYGALAGTSLPWDAVDVFFGDERWVPTDDPESNEYLARRALLDKAQPRSVYSMRDAGDDPESAAGAYDALLEEYGPLDLVHLGLGPDCHTASLFPGAPALAVDDRLVVATGDDLHPYPRLTMTYPALARARLIVFTVAGAHKREAFARVEAGADVPAARVEAARVVWLVDHAAAGR